MWRYFDLSISDFGMILIVCGLVCVILGLTRRAHAPLASVLCGLLLLVSGGLLSKSTGPNRNLISLTTDGRTCLSHFYNDIAASLREQITEFVKAHRINYRKKQEFVADYFRNPDGSFTVTLKILEVTKPLFELKFNVATRSLATSIYNSWNEKAPDVYCAIYEALIEN